jgi:hypothetical protein
MVIPVVILVVLALVVMRALMGVVAHEETAAPADSITLEPTVPGTPAPELRARADDGVRAFLTEASTSGPPSPVQHDSTVRAGGSPAWPLSPAVPPEVVDEHESAADRSRTTSS